MTTSFEPANPDFADAVRASFARQGLLASLGARLVSVAAGAVIIELPFSDRVGQQQGFFHGGAIGSIADTAAGYAALSLLPAASEVVTVEYKINFVRAARGDLLRAEGHVVRSGRSITVCTAEVAVVDGARATTCALMQGTFMRVAA